MAPPFRAGRVGVVHPDVVADGLVGHVRDLLAFERAGQERLAGESGAMAAVLLTILAFAAAVAAAIVLYRRSNPKVAYLLTAAPLLVAMVLLAESLSRLLPSWF